ncbi:hypothetical protein L0156_27610, partial [bacterium]|nr:hypothetical protein [bacterium]
MRKPFLLIFLLFAVAANAHEKHQQTKPVQSAPAKQESAAPPPASAQTEPDGEEYEGEVPGFKEALLSHPHNKIVHFPLALGIAGSLFVFIGLKKPEMLTAVRVLWLLAALAAVGAYFSGQSQEEPFEEGALHDVVELHEKLGTATGVCLGIGFLISLSRRLKKLAVFWAILVFTLISVTGYYG